jgi:hypothetical protein
MVKAMLACGVEADGFDFSRWCVDNASPQVREWVRWDDVLKLQPPRQPYLVLALDVLEHLPPEQVPVALANIAASLAELTSRGIARTAGNPSSTLAVAYARYERPSSAKNQRPFPSRRCRPSGSSK